VSKNENFKEELAMKRMTTFAFLTMLLCGTASILTACDTVEGAGKDIQHGGREIQNSAERNK
jgi:predicted small secreted protein